MLGKSHEILECERRLSRRTSDVRLLGEVKLSAEERDRLTNLLRQVISADPSEGLGWLEQNAPTCLACFLVGVGIVGYHDGDYWSAVREAAGLVEDPNWERKCGQAFLDFLEANDLPRFEIEGGHTYVTPILAHGGIPNSCLNEYFEDVLLRIVRDLLDPSDLEEITQELAGLREDNRERIRAEHRYNDLRKEVCSLEEKAENSRCVAEAYTKLTALWRLEEDVKTFDVPTQLPPDYEAFNRRNREELRRAEEEIDAFERRQLHCEQVAARFTSQDRQVLARAGAIETSISEYAELENARRMLDTLGTREKELVNQLTSQPEGILAAPWNDKYGELLIQLPFDRLRVEIKRVQAMISQQEEIQGSLDHLRTSLDMVSSPIGVICIISIFLILGLTLIVFGTLVLELWELTVAGTGFAVTAAVAAWIRYGRGREKKGQLEALEQSLRETISTREELCDSSAKLLGNLPLTDQQLRSPSLELHQALVALTDTYRELCELRQRRGQLWQQISQQAQGIERVAASVTINSTGNPISAMEQRLKEAREQEAAAVRAESELEDHVRPRLAALYRRQEEIHEELIRVDRLLIELGGGDIQAGLRQVEVQRQQQERTAKLREKLGEEYPDLEAVEQDIRYAQRDGKADRSVLDAKTKQLTEQLEKTRAQAERARQDLSYCPAAFPGVDEPIRRYLLYGGKSAEEFLVHSVSLVHQALAEDKVPDADSVGLPERVVKIFEHWWTEYIQYEPKGADQPDEKDTATGRRFRAPTLSLVPGTAEIVVHFHAQHYLASIAGTSAYLEVAGSISDARRQTFPLRVYKRTENLVETQELEFPLPFPAHRYEFSLKSDGNVIHRWEVAAMRSEAPYMAFDRRSGKLIKDKELPKRETWFLARQDFSLEPADCILTEGGFLYGQWKDYTYLELDLGQVDELQIVDDQGQRFLIPVSSEVLPTLDLVGGQRLESVHSEGVEIYVGPPPCIRVPIEDEAEWRLWRISIFPDEESSLQERKHYRLSELQEALDVHAGKRWVDVLLTDETLLGQRPVGRFMIRVRKPPYTDWRSTFCAVPDLEVAFDRDVYLPYETGRAPDVRTKIFTAKAAEFVPQPPAKLYETEDNLYAVRIDGAENILRGALRFRPPDRGGQRIPLTISIPKVKWRLQGLEDDQHARWCDTLEEVWLGDWETAPELFLIVALPPFVDGRLKLSLDGDSAGEQERDLREGKARFDLLAFGDALRAGPSVQTFMLTLPESQFGIEHVPIFKVRTRWEVENVECVQESQDRTIILNVTWTEKGKTGNKDRIVRLWSASGVPSHPIIEQKVLEGTRVTLQASVKDLPPGTYLLQLTVEDPWSTTEVSCPAQNAPNTQVIEIVPQFLSGFHPQAWGKKGRAIACVQLTPTRGRFLISGEPLERYFLEDQPLYFTKFGTVKRQHIALEPFEKLGLDPKGFTVEAYVEGGNREAGKKQPRAIAHAVAGALSLLDDSRRLPLIRAGFRFQFDPPKWVRRDHPRLLALSKCSKSTGDHSVSTYESRNGG